MKIRIELTESEIQHAIQEKMNQIMGGLNLEWHEANKIKFEGSVKFKKKAIRKLAERLKVYVEVYR